MQVNIDEFAADLDRLFVEIQSLESEVDVTTASDLSSVSANVTVDNTQVNRLLLEIVRVGEIHGIRFPRYMCPTCVERCWIHVMLTQFGSHFCFGVEEESMRVLHCFQPSMQ